MEFLEMMKKRRSVRTFDGKKLREEDEKKIMDFAGKVENPYNYRIEWKILDAKRDGLSTPVIVGTDTFIAGKMLPLPHAEEAFGYTFEKIVLFAESIGVGTTWIAGTMDRSSFERAVRLNENEVMPCVSPLGYAAEKMSVRETVMRKGIKADGRLAFEELFFDGSFDVPLKPEKAGKLAKALEAVRLAPSAVNKQPWRLVICDGIVHFYLKHARGYSPDKKWDIQKIDMGIALCHFELAANESGLDISFEISDPKMTAPTGSEYIASYRLA